MSEVKAKDFFWITEENHIEVQEMLQKNEVKCHTGEGIIDWHDGFNCIAVFEDDGRGFMYYQKVPYYNPDYGYRICKLESEAGEPK